MKSNTKKRLIAFMLCMVLVLSSTISAFADEPQNTDSQSQAEVVTEPTADEPQNTDSQSQAEVVTEPAADEATEDTTTEDVSTENTITEDVSDTPDIEIPSKKEWSVQVGNATVKVNGSADALPADAQLSVTEITSEDEVKEIEKAVEEKAIEEQFSIKNIFSYDIKFLVNGSEVSEIITVSTAKDSNGKTQIIMRFEPGYKLESGYTYYVTAKIQPTTKAYLKYQNESYTDTGDENTDEYLETDKKPGKDTRNDGTSSKQKGFYSNESANVTYKYNNKTYEKPYAKPVIQVNASTDSHTVVKQWENDSDKVAVGVELKAYVTEAADSQINADNPKYLTSADVKNLPTSMQVNLSEANKWTYTWENLPDKYFYETTDGIKETAIHYTVEEVQTEATNAFYGQVTESDDGKTTTILNKKKDQEDKPFIEVTKTFEGLTKTQIQELANSENPYTITLIHTDTNTSKTLIMNAGKLNDILQSNDNKKVWTYTWKLEDCLDGTYKVSESNYGKDGYDVTVTVNGQQVTNWNDFSVSTKQATIEEYKQSENTTTCSPKTFSIGKVNLIVAKLTANEGYFVWTNTPVSISERKEIVKLINDKIDGIKGIGFSPEAELQKCYFYSGNGIKDTLVFRNGEIKYDGQDVLTFDASKQWSMFAAGTYTFTEPQNAEIQITNTYSEQTADLDLIKTSVTGTKFDGAEFKLYKKNDEGAYELQKFEYTDESGKNQTRETIQVINTEGSKAELKNLQSGQYYLEEVKAPEACMLLADKIYFKQEKAGSHAAGVDYGADNVPVKLFTGELVLLKYGDGNVNNALANAEFVLYKDGEEVPLTFTKQENGKYKYAPDAEDATATLVTDENGMIDVEGLDVGSYHFEETKAPEGYSINTDGKTLTLTVNGDVATAKLYNEGQLNDTKLSALPSTGGIGTTIFTIAGCVIMIAAAGLFFASRKKSDNK